MTAPERINTSGIATKSKRCRHCGELFQPGNITNHERVCITPYTIERVLEMGGLTEWAAEHPDECWEWPGVKTYGAISKRHTHRLVLEMKLGRRLQSGMSALHTCDNKPCINPSHLYEGTQARNIRDMFERAETRFWVHHPESYVKGWETRRRKYGSRGQSS